MFDLAASPRDIPAVWPVAKVDVRDEGLNFTAHLLDFSCRLCAAGRNDDIIARNLKAFFERHLYETLVIDN